MILKINYWALFPGGQFLIHRGDTDIHDLTTLDVVFLRVVELQ